MGTARKSRQAEREATRNRRALIHPSCEHASVTGKVSGWLHPRGMSPEQAGPRSGCKIWDPLFSGCALADRARAAQSLPDVVHYRDKNELRNRVRGKRRGGKGEGTGDDPQQTGLIELE